MDIFTHGLLGALSASILRGHSPRYQSAAIGAVSALLPDLDVFIRSADDPLLVLEYHRHFSHSLLFAPFGAAIAAFLLWPLFRAKLSLSRIYGLSLAGYTSACLLDTCTSYGTRLFWPLLSNDVALNIIAVVDPAFTVILLAGLVLTLMTARSAWCGVAVGAIYLAFGALQHHRALDHISRWAKTHDLPDASIQAKPTLGNLLLWRALVVHQGDIYARAVRITPLGGVTDYRGEHGVLIDPSQWGSLSTDSRAYRDLQRFYRLTGGMLIADPYNPARIGDARYAMLPTSLIPLWGIEIDIHASHEPPDFFIQRDRSPAVRDAFLQMLLGRPRSDILAPTH